MTPTEKLKKAIALAEGDNMAFEIDGKPITLSDLAKYHAVIKLPIQPFDL